MGQSKLELAVGTGQWDAGLKKAQQALNSFTQAQGGLQQALAKDNGDMQKFVQMMAKMDSTANTSKGQMNDYKRVLEQLTAQYNNMSDAQKKSIGQDYLQTIDALKQKFAQAKQQVDDFNRSLGETSNAKLPEISGVGGGLFSGGKFGGMLQVFGGNMMTKAAGLAASFASELGDAVSQGIELARAGEGIRIAFDRLGRGDILDGLREATHGTVTDLELMKAAVKFNDFKLPLEELGTMLAFAQQKAKDTGQSVDYMVDSIVTGLGRKSLMILDNLGLSAAEIKEKMAETGDMTKAVGEIIREQMQKAGDYVETAADRATQATVQQQNKLEELGRTFQPLAEEANTMWNSIKIGALDLIQTAIQPLIDKLTTAGRLRSLMGQMNAGKGGNTRVQDQLATLAGSNHKDTLYNGIIANYNKLIERRWRAINAYNNNHASINTVLMDLSRQTGKKFSSIQAVKEDIQALEAMKREYIEGAKVIMNPVKADIDTSGAENNVDSLKKKLKDLEEQRKKAIKAGDTELAKNLTKQINQTKTDIRGLDPSALKTTSINNTPKTEEQLNNEQIQKLTQEYIKATDDRRKAIEGEIKTLQDRNKEIARLKDMALGKIGDDGSLPAMTQQLKELQSAQSESASGREWDDYQKKIDDVTSKINVLKGVLPKDQQATFTVEVNAEQLEQLRMLLPSDEETVRINVEEGRIDLPDIPTEIEQVVNTKVGEVVTPEIATDIVQTISTRLGSIVTPDIAETLTQVINTKVGDVITPDIAEELTQVVNVETGTVNLPELPKDETIRVNITATTADAMKEVRDMVGEIEGWQVAIEPKIEIKEQDLRTPFEKLKDSLKIEIAEENMQVDTTTLQTLMKTSIQNGIDGLDPNFSALQEKMREGMNIPDETWQALQDQINEKLKGLGIEPIKIDFKTGNIANNKSDVDGFKNFNDKFSQLSSGVGSIVSGIQQMGVEIPKELQSTLSVLQGISTIMTGVLAIITLMNTKQTAQTILSFLPGYAHGGLIHAATGYMVPGNDHADRTLIAASSGELILNRAQQGVIASQLENGNGGGMHVVGEIQGEKIVLVANRFLKRSGQGELVTWK